MTPLISKASAVIVNLPAASRESAIRADFRFLMEAQCRLVAFWGPEAEFWHD